MHLFFVLCILKVCESRVFITYLNHSYLSENHGLLLGYFTFSGKGIAGLKYEIKPFYNDTDIRLSLFPTAFDPYINLKRIKKYYSRSACNEFYKKAIYTAKLFNDDDKLNLGRFSGGFAVSFVLTNKYSCHQFSPKNTKEIAPEGSFGFKITVYNHDDDGLLRDHLSAVDQGTETIILIILCLYALMMIWTFYSIKNNSNSDVPLMVCLQQVIVIIVILEIIIWSLLFFSYKKLSHTGVMPLLTEIISEIAAQMIKYMELYIIISWTLSSPRTQERRGDLVARFLSSCCIVQCCATFFHYLIVYRQLENEQLHATPNGIGNFGEPTLLQGNTHTTCMTVWECESHIFTYGWASPLLYSDTLMGIIVVIMNWFAGAIGAVFVIHLLKLGLATTRQQYSASSSNNKTTAPTNTNDNVSPVRRAYVSVFCSASICWFGCYGAAWIVASLVSDYCQYKLIVFIVSVSHLMALPAVLKATRISPREIEASILSKQSTRRLLSDNNDDDCGDDDDDEDDDCGNENVLKSSAVTNTTVVGVGLHNMV